VSGVARATASAWLLAGGRTLSLEPWAIMGVLNATPDSFSDGGVHLDPLRAAEAGLAMVEEGAAILDVGGESTRPGAARVPVEEQIRRVVPVIRAIRRASRVPISVDTTLSAVARAALDEGADAVNDVAAGAEDPALLPLVASRGAGIVLMHRLAPPPEDAYSDRHARPPAYGDVAREVAAWLLERAALAEGAGVEPPSIVLDPGLGFGKDVRQNFELLARVGEVVALGRPVLVGASRKSFLGAAAAEPDPTRRDVASVVAAVAAWSAGARILRTHEVRGLRQGLAVAAAILAAGRLEDA